MKKILAILFTGSIIISANAQPATIERPKLVVGIVIDQMRWDYPYRYYNRYAENGGFKRLLQQFFVGCCSNDKLDCRNQFLIL